MKEIEKIFKNHHNFHSTIGADFVKSDSGHINQVSADYQGRVLYELLQNAFDRAEKKIIVKVKGTSLFVANDGERFTYNSEHDYKNGGVRGEKFERCDFQSLCSISTSNKTAAESIGNKGVGFKSVYTLGRFANIHTKGIINPTKENKQEATISFRLYDVFDDVNTIPEKFNDDVKVSLIKSIDAIHREFEQRGVPGYYYPLQLDTNAIFNDFDKEIVTIIEVPFSSEEEVQKLLEEIKKIHFGFVGLKYNNFEIKFETEGETPFTKNISTDDDTLFSTKLNNDKIQKLAKDAGVEINEAAVAIKFKNEPTGLFYNYLPTKKHSPFKYVDFHADFHTTVDRKDINFDGDKVGAYNRALLDACVELLFQTVNMSLPFDKQVKLNLNYIKVDVVGIKHFKWQFLQIENAYSIFNTVRSILSIWNNEYHKASSLFTQLAFHFFSKKREVECHKDFFKTIIDFINYFSRDDGDKWKWPDEFKKCLGSKLREVNVQFSPDISLSNDKKILYRQNEELKINLPDEISVTNFEINDTVLQEALGISDFNDFNELLKYFKQCDFSGEYSELVRTEEEQKITIQSLYSIFLFRKENEFLSTHRYNKAFTSELRKKNGPLNLANFNCATIFLKLTNQRYKPAQLCTIEEIDYNFLPVTDNIESLNQFLVFLGVSKVSKYTFVDENIYSSLNKGLNYIPKLQSVKNNKDEINGDLIRKIRVASTTNKLIHPAVINDNNYSFLKNISNSKLKPEFDNLRVKNYNNFPSQYLDILREKLDANLKSNENSIIQFYQNIFEAYSNQGKYLVIQNSKLNWGKDVNFHILNNKVDFDLCVKQFSTKPILAYYSGKIPQSLKDQIISPSKGEVHL